MSWRGVRQIPDPLSTNVGARLCVLMFDSAFRELQPSLDMPVLD
jgi:hypothetical protein